ncbi:MAG: TatD family hydrolase [Wenzhouxiangellaceae bacterium]
MKQTHSTHVYDFHCHVDLYPDPPALIKECERQFVTVLAVTTTPRAWAQNLEWTKDSAFVHAAVGLHPELVGERFEEVSLLEDLISQSRLVGEIGLDGSPKHRSHFNRQKEVFTRALIAANRHGERLVSIHSRRAAADVIALIDQHIRPERVTCILHWFSGSQAQLRFAAKLGCYFSVNEAMLNSDRGRALVKEIPNDRILTETDAPFAIVNGKQVHPSSIDKLIQKLADLYRTQPADLRHQIDLNAKAAFSKAGILL